jgi:hypothetical protein
VAVVVVVMVITKLEPWATEVLVVVDKVVIQEQQLPTALPIQEVEVEVEVLEVTKMVVVVVLESLLFLCQRVATLEQQLEVQQ